MNMKKAIVGVLTILLLAGNMSFAKSKVKESAVTYKAVMQEIAQCGLAGDCQRWLSELMIPAGLNKTGKGRYKEITKALNNSSIFNTYVVELYEGPYLSTRVLDSAAKFFANPYGKRYEFSVVSNGVYRFSLGCQAWVTVDRNERKIYVVESMLRDATKSPTLYYILPN